MTADFSGCLLASDIDGTFIVNNTICDENIKKVNEFVQRGGMFILASGRSVQSVVDVAKRAGVSGLAIANNGCVIFDLDKDLPVWVKKMEPEQKELVKPVLDNFPDIGVVAFGVKDLFVLNRNSNVDRYQKYENLVCQDLSFDSAKQKIWTKVIYTAPKSRIDELIEFSKTLKNESCYYSHSGDCYFELMPKGASKAEAMLRIAEIYGIKNDNIYAIGDFYNDEEMILKAGVGAFVKEAPDDLKIKADYISKSCADGGVADFINYIDSIK